jgi:hypothetical protein
MKQGLSILALVLLTVAPSGASAQASTVDTAGVVTGLARALLTWYAQPGDFRGPTAIQFKAAVPNSWEAGLEAALRRLDSTSVTPQPRRLTLRTVVNVQSVTLDSANFRIAFNRCIAGGRFTLYGNLVDFTLVRSDTGWVSVAERRTGHGDGQCRWPADSTGTAQQAFAADKRGRWR